MKTANFWPKLSVLMAILALGGLSLATAGEFKVGAFKNWDKPTMDISEAIEISKASTVLIDVENMANNPEMLKFIRQKNPKIILICRISLTEIILPTIDRPIQYQFIQEMSSLGLEKEFMLRDSAGRKVVSPREGGGYILNISADCPTSKKIPSYNQFITDFFIKNVFFYPVWDGIYINNSWKSLYELIARNGDTTDIDANKDGKGDEKYRVGMAWKKGFDDFLNRILATQDSSFIPFNKVELTESPSGLVANF